MIVEVDPERYGPAPRDPLAGFRWQDAIEARAFAAAGGQGRAPAQTVHDFLAGRPSLEVPRASYPLGVTAADLAEVLPAEILAPLAQALIAFEAELPGFAGPDGLLIAPESRTTSPIRFSRDERCCSTTVEGLYPIGEGAGYAGGIISSALDGLRAARAITARAPPRERA